MFGFSAILMCSWESLLSSLSIVLANGGTAGLVWTWLLVWIGFTAVYLSMAEVRTCKCLIRDTLLMLI